MNPRRRRRLRLQRDLPGAARLGLTKLTEMRLEAMEQDHMDYRAERAAFLREEKIGRRRSRVSRGAR